MFNLDLIGSMGIKLVQFGSNLDQIESNRFHIRSNRIKLDQRGSRWIEQDQIGIIKIYLYQIGANFSERCRTFQVQFLLEQWDQLLLQKLSLKINFWPFLTWLVQLSSTQIKNLFDYNISISKRLYCVGCAKLCSTSVVILLS